MPSITLPTYHAAQQRLKDHPSRRKVPFWARQTGKSTFGQCEAVEALMRGQTGAVFAYTRPYVSEFFYRVKQAIPESLITEATKGTPMEIRTVMGGYLIFWSVKDRPDAGRGGTNHLVIYEEAGLIPNLKKHFFGTVEATLGVHDGTAYFMGNAKPRGDFNDLFHMGQRGEDDWWSDRIESHENPHGIPPDKLAQSRRLYEKEGWLPLWDMEFRAIPMADAGSPWAQYPECLSDLSTDAPLAWGWDLAEEQDHTIGIALDHRMRVCRIVDTKQHGATDWGEIEDVVFEQTGAAEAEVDETGVGKPVVEALQRRAREAGRVNHRGETNIHGYKFTPGPSGGKQQLYKGLKAEIRRGEIRFPDGPITEALQTAENVIADTIDGPVVTIAVPHGIHKDYVDALALAVRSYHRVAHRHPAVLAGVQDMPSGERLEQLMREERERIARIRGAA